jgi:hypothetical protein
MREGGMKRRISGVALACLLALVGMVSFASPASAATCPKDFVCLWAGDFWTGSSVSVARPSGTCYTFASGFKNAANSWVNNRSNHFGFQAYDGDGCTGGLLASDNYTSPYCAPCEDNFIYIDQNTANSIFFNTG